MRVRVGVRDKQFDIAVGDGRQSLQWLANAALCRYDSSFGLELGPPVAVRLEDGTQLPMQAAIVQSIVDGGQVFVQLGKEHELDGPHSPLRPRTSSPNKASSNGNANISSSSNNQTSERAAGAGLDLSGAEDDQGAEEGEAHHADSGDEGVTSNDSK